MMLYLVLCSFSTLIGKYFFKLNQHDSLHRWCDECLALTPQGMASMTLSGEVFSCL